jgi:hypothetical protein
VARSEQQEVGTRGQCHGRPVHDFDVGHVAAGKDDLIDPLPGDQGSEFLLEANGDARRIAGPASAGG